MHKKNIAVSLIVVLLVIGIFNAGVMAKNLNLSVPSVILMEAETGQVLYAQNPDTQRPPASITKIMTIILAMDFVEKGKLDLDEEVTISKYAESMGGSQIYLADGDKLTVNELLEAVTIASANDASVALAETIGGTYSNFIEMMNDKAKKLGMENTHFSNSTGLPVEGDNHFSTAYDIAIMTKKAVQYEEVLEWASIWVDYLDLSHRRAMLVNTNKLVKKYPGLDGLKTGHTDEAGYCLAATAQRDDMRLISVVLGADTEKEREDVTTKLLNYGFNSFSKQVAIEEKEKIEGINVPNGKKRDTFGYTEDSLKVVLQRGNQDNLEIKSDVGPEISAPISKGDVIGKRAAFLGDKRIGSVNIVAGEDIEKANIFIRLWRSFVDWIGGWLEKI